MRLLRVLVSATPTPDTAMPWAVVDERGELRDHGHAAANGWPAADHREAVIAASALRVVGLALPPLPAGRATSAVTFALEERLATPLESSLVVPGPQDSAGRLTALVVSRALARTLLLHAPAFERIVAEPQQVPAPPADAWRWCASQAHGVVVTPDGDAFAVGAAADATLPDELRLALEHAARSGKAPMRVLASVPAADAHRDAWTRASGVPFEADAVAPWWRPATMAPDLRPAFAAALAPAAPPPRRASYALAMGLLVAAGVLHVGATLGTWAWRKAELARTREAIAEVARSVGASDATGVARAHASAMHRAGQAVATDAWPLLAQAAPALSALPPGALRSARFAGGAWTLELAAIDDAALAAFETRLRAAGLGPVAARAGGGARVRLEAGA